jgi:hypothetical protein
MKSYRNFIKSIQVVTACILFSASAGAAENDARPKSEFSQKIAKKKAMLADAKGKKRVKLIKEIAEMENKVLENTMQSFR